MGSGKITSLVHSRAENGPIFSAQLVNHLGLAYLLKVAAALAIYPLSGLDAA
jgi:hypothetical protein